MNKSIFEIIGPIMVGPSSSHTAGAARLSRIARMIVGVPFTKVSFGLHGSFAKTYKGHGTDKALVAGALGLSEDDFGLAKSFELAKESAIDYDFYEIELEDCHENTVKITFYDGNEQLCEVIGSSVGGGNIIITSINGFDMEFSARVSTLVIQQHDRKGSISAITGVLADNNINIGNMKFSRKAKGKLACCIIETDSDITPKVVDEVCRLNDVIDAKYINPLSGVPGHDISFSDVCNSNNEDIVTENYAYSSIAELLALSKAHNMPIWRIVLEYEKQHSELSENEIFRQLDHYYEIMIGSTRAAISGKFNSRDSLIAGVSEKQWNYGNSEDTISGDMINKLMAKALSCSETNDAMGIVCAAPTAGACGVLPSVLSTIGEKYELERRRILEGLLTASGIGVVIAINATFSGAEAGCQAECGAAAAMAAAAAADLAGATPDQSAQAASLAIINAMGLVCDPVAGLVQIPCAMRNASQAVSAIICADMAIAGVDGIIPPDEVIQAMRKVGAQLPSELRETAKGGVAATPTAKEITKRIFG